MKFFYSQSVSTVKSSDGIKKKSFKIIKGKNNAIEEIKGISTNQNSDVFDINHEIKKKNIKTGKIYSKHRSFKLKSSDILNLFKESTEYKKNKVKKIKLINNHNIKEKNIIIIPDIKKDTTKKPIKNVTNKSKKDVTNKSKKDTTKEHIKNVTNKSKKDATQESKKNATNELKKDTIKVYKNATKEPKKDATKEPKKDATKVVKDIIKKVKTPIKKIEKSNTKSIKKDSDNKKTINILKKTSKKKNNTINIIKNNK